MNNLFKDRFEIRAITANDKEALQLGLHLLYNESRRQRFFSSRKDFTDKELEFFTEVDQKNHLALVAFYLEDDKNLTPAGTIRCVRNLKRPSYAELAITIIDRFHGQGLGYELVEQLSHAAQQEQITYFFGDFHTSNSKMLRLLEKYCAKHNISNDKFVLKRKEDGFLYFEMPLAN